MNKGFWLKIDGPNGAGKTTIVNRTLDLLGADGYDDVVVVKTPSTRKMGKDAIKVYEELVRNNISSRYYSRETWKDEWAEQLPTESDIAMIYAINGKYKGGLRDSQYVEDLNATRPYELFAMDMMDIFYSVILPAMREGKLVISDRWCWSTYVYGKLFMRSQEDYEELTAACMGVKQAEYAVIAEDVGEVSHVLLTAAQERLGANYRYSHPDNPNSPLLRLDYLEAVRKDYDNLLPYCVEGSNYEIEVIRTDTLGIKETSKRLKEKIDARTYLRGA